MKRGRHAITQQCLVQMTHVSVCLWCVCACVCVCCNSSQKHTLLVITAYFVSFQSATLFVFILYLLSWHAAVFVAKAKDKNRHCNKKQTVLSVMHLERVVRVLEWNDWYWCTMSLLCVLLISFYILVIF